MLKGTYEHADTFVQRDVNPIGIWRPVKLIEHDDVREEHQPWIRTSLGDDAQSAAIAVAWPLWNDGAPQGADLAVRIVSPADDAVAARASRPVELVAGANVVDQTLTVHSPRLWSTWDRGTPALYRAEFTLARPGKESIRRSVDFGIRTVELRRSADETRLYLNGKPLYLRGATYWPELYLSNVDRARYERDVATAVRAGINAFRVHVHTENPEFYEVCDRAGVILFQDFDLNWAFPTDEAFAGRAVKLFGSMIRELRNHPSIAVWIAMNEVNGDPNTVRPGPQLVAEARRIDPTRPTIKNSHNMRDDLESGDTTAARCGEGTSPRFTAPPKNLQRSSGSTRRRRRSGRAWFRKSPRA
jgi:beta-mannosidase